MMETLDFCFNYVTAFLILLNYADDDTNEIDRIEDSRDECIESVERLELPDEQKKKLIDDYNKSFDKRIFSFIKEEVADKDPEFFQAGISKLKELLTSNAENAKSLNMILDNGSLTIEDYYKNYLIAFNYCLVNSKEFEIENEEEEEVNG